MLSFYLLITILLISKTNEFSDYLTTSVSYFNNDTVMKMKLIFTGLNIKQHNIKNYYLNNLKHDEIAPINNLTFTVSLVCSDYVPNSLHFKINDTNNFRSEPDYLTIDYQKMMSHSQCLGKSSSSSYSLKSLPNYQLKFSETNEPFYFYILDKDGELIYKLDSTYFIYSDTLITFEQFLSSRYIFGFGERNHDFILNPGIYTIWGNDTGVTYKDTGKGGFNLMGHQPIGLHRTKKGNYLGLIFANANAQDVEIKTFDSKIYKQFNQNAEYKNIKNYYEFDKLQTSHVLRHITIGGIINYFLTISDSAEKTISQIHKIIGRPTIPPFWGLGFHQCRWGYSNTMALKNVLNNYNKFAIPLETIWTDIDLLYGKRNFYLDHNFYDINEFIKKLHMQSKKFIALVDYGIPKTNEDQFYKMGVKTNAFLYSNYTGDFLESYVWPGNSVFPDLFSKEGVKLWNAGLEKFYNDVKFDGMWIDMNEPAMIVVRQGGYGENLRSYWNVDQRKNLYFDIPYIPGCRYDHCNLNTKSISVNGYSKLNNNKNNFHTMYNIKTLISKNQVKITNEFLKSKNKRPFIISRANTIGHGVYGFHWLGDNLSSFEFMKNSISNIFNYNIFGIPFTGADICGFHESASDELCARWHILGSFYPFARNHNVDNGKSQEPWVFESPSRHLKRNMKTRPPEGYTLHAARLGIKMRYSIMRYAYSQLMMISIGLRGAYFKPVFFEFPDDDELINNDNILNKEVMIGDSLLFMPNLNDNENEYQAYFPGGIINKFPSGELFHNNPEGNQFNLNGSFLIINIFLIGGRIIPYQDTTSNVLSSYDLRNLPISLIVNPDEKLYAEGNVFYDMDEVEIIKNKNFLHVKIIFNYDMIIFKVLNEPKSYIDYKYIDNRINNIIIYNVKKNIMTKYEMDEKNNINNRNNNEKMSNKNSFSDALIYLNDGSIFSQRLEYDKSKDLSTLPIHNFPIEKISVIYFY